MMTVTVREKQGLCHECGGHADTRVDVDGVPLCPMCASKLSSAIQNAIVRALCGDPNRGVEVGEGAKLVPGAAPLGGTVLTFTEQKGGAR